MSTESILTAGLQLTRIASTEEFVQLDSPHWAIEPYLPITTADLVDALLARRGDTPAERAPAALPELEAPARERMRDVFRGFAELLHHRYRPMYSRFAKRYAALDPDRDTRPLLIQQDSATSGQEQLEAVAEISQAGQAVLVDAGYTEVSHEELEQAVGMSSHWGVPLHVDFDVFEAIIVYARGDVIGQRAKRRWQNLYREVIFDVPLYQRVVVMFKLRPGFRTDDELDHTMLHLRMFKNVPKPDIDMLLPGTRVRFTWLDHLRNIVPSLGGIGITLFKISRVGFFVAAITLSVLAVLAGLLLALIGYAVRSVVNHLNVKNRYMLNLTRNLYYQKLDSNAGVAYRLIEEAESQRHREVVLAYYAMLTAGVPISQRRLRRRVERMVREMVDVEVEFRVGDAIALLEEWNLIHRCDDGKLQVCEPEEAMRRIGAYWDRALKA